MIRADLLHRRRKSLGRFAQISTILRIFGTMRRQAKISANLLSGARSKNKRENCA